MANYVSHWSCFIMFNYCLLSHAGYYTCVEVIFTLRRQVGFYMMGVYAPTLLIVVLSWLSFWINPDASAARVPLGTDYFKSIDQFLCLQLTFTNTHKICKYSLCCSARAWLHVRSKLGMGESVYVVGGIRCENSVVKSHGERTVASNIVCF